jgi:hypothetical protein
MAKHHRMYGTPTYKSWAEMKYRCGNPKRKGYVNIAYEERWTDFREFFKDMGVRPTGTSLDRKNGLKGYSKDNCRWATYKEQRLNTSNIHLFTFNGESLTLSDWSRKTGIGRNVLAQRIYCLKWTIEKTLTYKRGRLS